MTAAPRRFFQITFALAGIACVLAILGAWYRGPWLDDFATFRFANPSVPLAVAWHKFWPSETNPPLFYLIAREGVALHAHSLFARRCVNLLPLAVLLFWFVRNFRRYPQQRLFLALFWLIATTSSYFFWDFSSYRSYFYQYAAAVIFLGGLALDELEQRRETDWAQIAMVPLLINLHQVTALYAGALLLVLLIRDARRGLWNRFTAYLVTAEISVVPLLMFTWNQISRGDSAFEHVAWILPHGTWAALRLIMGFLPRALGQNWIALLAGLAALIWARPRGPQAKLLGLLAAAAVLGTGLLLAANLATPLIVDRYFALLTATCACALAALIRPLAERWRTVAPLILAFAAFYLAVSFNQIRRDLRWNSGAAIVARLVAQCPTTRVHAGSLPPDPAEQTGMVYLAAVWHLTLLPIVPDHPDACPVLYWTEYQPPSRVDLAQHHGDLVRAANDRAGFGLSSRQLAHTKAIKSQNGVILVVSPVDIKLPDVR